MAGINVYEIVTERILAALDNGVVPWRLPWRVSGSSGFPKNLVSGKEYRGINILLLGSQGYASPYWLTYKQAVARGGTVRKGEKSTPVVFWKILDGKKKEDKRFILRYYSLFSVDQCDGLDVPKPETKSRTFYPIEECEKVVREWSTRPPIDHGGNRACYIPSFDRICMPPKEAFGKPEEYYSTLFHEMIHASGHESRLNRDGIMNPIRFGSHLYSFEELVAECGSAFLCGKVGIENETIENSAAYIQSWVRKLKNEPRWIVEAAGKAAKASDYILGISNKKLDESEEEVA